MEVFNLVILSNEIPNDHKLWELACKGNASVNYRVVDLTKNNWLERIQSEPFDYLLAKPVGLTQLFKQLYDERIYILSKELKYKIFPSADEIFIYENKRFLSFWLKAHNLPHPETDVFYDFEEAKTYVSGHQGTLVAKTNVGASGSGVKILSRKEDKLAYIQEVFKGKGAAQRIGPNLNKSGIIKRGLHYIFHPGDISKKLNIYKSLGSNQQKGFVIFQEYIPHQFEWRIVRIGDSFFAHKKLVKKEKASGSLIKGYETPPSSLLDFVKTITDRFELHSQAVDVFETSKGEYLINEMQCIFGQSDPYQMLVDGKPGRFIYDKGNWVFEEGMYNQNESYNLRVEYVINKIQQSRSSI